MIVSAGITEHIEGLSQLIRWQDVTTSTLKNSQKTVKKSQKGTIKGDQTCTRTLLFLQESLSTLSSGLFQLIWWQDVFKLVYDRTYQIKVLQDLTGPNQTEPDRTRPDQTGPDRTRPDQTKPDRTRPDQTGPDRTRPYQTGQNRTRPDHQC